ncbi:hypothetical protein FRC04_006386 [Tulasnella sp. 424]|nr:hypothetical protein FRC04_006386 [Tulasnella sp. 424]
MTSRRTCPRYTTYAGCLAWWSCIVIFSPILVVLIISQILVDLIVETRHEYKRWAEERKWRHYPQYPNGTFITGRLTESEPTDATQAAVRLSSSSGEGQVIPFLPLEIVREIILHATNTFPTPCSIHRPYTSSLSLPPLQPPFPYSSYWFKDDMEVDRKLHALSMRIKLSVSRVSRMWRDVAVEFLFNSVRIQNSQQIPLLWRAFEAHAKRRGEVVAKGTVAQRGAAAWWIRELWVDLDKFKHIVQLKSEEPLPSFDMADFLRMCPNIVVYRWSGRFREFRRLSAPRFSLLAQNRAIIRQVMGLTVEEYAVPEEQGQEVQESERDIPDTGRRIKLHFMHDCEPFLHFFTRRSISSSAPVAATFPSIYSMALHSLILPQPMYPWSNARIRIPNLTHLSITGVDSLRYATAEFAMPSLRSFTCHKSELKERGASGEPYLQRFLEKHGLVLEELVLLDKTDPEQLQRLDQLCPILQTVQAHYLDLPKSTVSSVGTVGLYGLEHAGATCELGGSLVRGIIETFPNVTTIQDMSWRSAVIRQRAFTNWRDPEGAKHRMFWTQVLRAIRTMIVQEVIFLDWRGRVVDTVPTSPPGDSCSVLCPDDQLMDALMSVILIISQILVDLIVETRHEYKKRAEERKWRHYPQYPNGTFITGRLTESEPTAAAQVAIRLSSSSGQGKVIPFLPLEIVREIILHATNTFPTPCSIHCPSSSSLSLPPFQPSFPYSSYWFKDDMEVDRKLHALSMRIKLSVSRVSRTWRDVAVEFLFNSIRIQNSQQIPLLWCAFEAHAKRRGELVAKGAVAQPGAAAWWIRELWVDLDKFKDIVQPESEEPLPSFDLTGLLRMCPNIVVYRWCGRWRKRGFGRLAALRFSRLAQNGAIIRQVMGLPAEERSVPEEQGQEVQNSELDMPDTGRRIELHFTYDYEPFLQLFNRRSISSSAPVAATFPSIYSLTLHSLFVLPPMYPRGNVTIRLPNLTHLSIMGVDSLRYATVEFAMPSLRSVTCQRSELKERGASGEPYLQRFLEKHGLVLEELVLLDKTDPEQLQRLDQLCPILQTVRAHYLDLPESIVSSVGTVGLYGLEHTEATSELGESLVRGIIETFPNVTTIQDMSWRSAVVRQRAFTNWRDPEGAKYRLFWTQVLRAIRTMDVQEVTFLDWRGKVVDMVPTSPPGDSCSVLCPDDQLMDALMSEI